MISLFNDIISEKTAGAQRNDRLFLNSLQKYFRWRNLTPPASPDARLVDDYRRWLVSLDLSDTTVQRYLQRFRALWRRAVKEGRRERPAEDPFAGVSSGHGVARVKSDAGLRALQILKSMARSLPDEPRLFRRARLAWLFSFYCGGLNAATLASLRGCDIHEGRLHLPDGRSLAMIPQMSEILSETGGLVGDYLFSGDGRMDAAVWFRNVEGALSMRRVSISVDDSLARRCYEELLRRTVKGDTDDDTRKNVADKVRNLDISWWAVRIADRRKADALISFVESTSEFRGRVQVYYPFAEIARRVDGKVTVRRTSIISGVAFLGCTLRTLRRLLGVSREIAWVYCNPGSVTREFARIGNYEMLRFRMMVERLSGDMRLVEATPDMMRPGRRVIVTGGPLRGYEGEITDIRDSRGKVLRLLRIGLISDTGLRIVADIPESQLRPVK